MNHSQMHTPQPFEMPATTRAPSRLQSESRSLGEIVSELWEHTGTLVRQELQLASAELDRKVTRVKADATTASIGGGILYAGFLAVVASIILLLSKVTEPWIASLIVGVLMSFAGYLFVQRGRKDLERLPAKPERTVRTTKESAQTLKEAVK